MKNKIKIFDLKDQYKSIKKEVRKKIDDVLESGKFILGKNVKIFEERVSSYLKTKYAISCNSGTDALILSLKAQGIEKDDEIITTPFTYFATVEAIIHVGAKPVFVDINPHTFNLNYKKIEDAITKKTKGVLLVHIFGQPCDMDEIRRVCSKYNLYIIEDCAQSFGSTYKRKQTGTFGDFGCFSFFPTKNLGCYGDGGLIITNNSKKAKKLQMLRNHGGLKRNDHRYVGYNSRLDEIQAVVLLTKLKLIKDYIKKRIRVANLYSELITNEKIIIPYQIKNICHTYNQYTILTKQRKKLTKFLTTNNIPHSIYYPDPMYKVNALKNNFKGMSLKCTERVTKQCLSLPIYPEMSTKDVEMICDILNRY